MFRETSSPGPETVLVTLFITDSFFCEVTALFGEAAAAHWSDRFVEHLFVGPMWPATILAMIVWAFVLISVLGVFSPDFGFDGPEVDAGIDLDPGFDVDAGVDMDAGMDADASVDPGHDMHGDFFGGIAAATMRAVHLDRVPLMIWLAVFSLFFWVLTYVLWFEFDSRRYAPVFVSSTLLSIRNLVIAVAATRLMTAPLHRLLVPPTHYHSESLVGGTAVVETSQVDDAFGRARYATNAAPLLIDIRTSGEPIKKGSTVKLLSYDVDRKIYQVEAVQL